MEDKDIAEENENAEAYDNQNEQVEITPWYILTLLKPLIADELVATLRFDREGLRIKFPNGQKFRLYIKPI